MGIFFRCSFCMFIYSSIFYFIKRVTCNLKVIQYNAVNIRSN
ncbi:hypothetical protein HMPREF1581_00918 [Gardnerella vaginalis JCP8108]|uniref:Uncharacterized protein n=1 Tax=Gardnerella vaginalis JCP8108 TaxID=1261066 RepID=S4GMF6_GARVA|nr:hypothetical protein HMPREF1581_00918 [Gardnerella vaginalis JCP8108]